MGSVVPVSDSEALRASIDTNPEMAGAGAIYVSSALNLEYLKSDAFIEEIAVITPTDETAPEPRKLNEALWEAGFNCGVTGLSYAMAASACAGTTGTMGVTAPLCVVSAASLSSSTYSCTKAISRAYAAGFDEGLLDQMDDNLKNNDLVRFVDSSFKWIGRFADALLIKGAIKTVSQNLMFKNMQTALKEFGTASKAKAGAESLESYRKVCGAFCDTMSNSALKKHINSLGFRPKFRSSAVNKQLDSLIRKNNSQFRAEIMTNSTILSDEKSPVKPHAIHFLQKISEQEPRTSNSVRRSRPQLLPQR